MRLIEPAWPASRGALPPWRGRPSSRWSPVVRRPRVTCVAAVVDGSLTVASGNAWAAVDRGCWLRGRLWICRKVDGCPLAFERRDAEALAVDANLARSQQVLDRVGNVAVAIFQFSLNLSSSGWETRSGDLLVHAQTLVLFRDIGRVDAERDARLRVAVSSAGPSSPLSLATASPSIVVYISKPMASM